MHATPVSYDQRLRADCEQIVAQGWLKFLVPWGPGKITVRSDEAARALGYKTKESIYAEAERAGTWLEIQRRASGQLRAEIRITARSVELQMAREALEGGMIRVRAGVPQPPLFMERAKSLLTHMSRAQLDDLAAEILRLKGGRK